MNCRLLFCNRAHVALTPYLLSSNIFSFVVDLANFFLQEMRTTFSEFLGFEKPELKQLLILCPRLYLSGKNPMLFLVKICLTHKL